MMHPAEVLTHADLVAPDERWGLDAGPLIRETGVRCGTPLDANRGRERLRVRVAVHPALDGEVAAAAAAARRILDAPPLLAALRANPAADFVLGVPDLVFHDGFRACTVERPGTDLVEHAWFFVPATRSGRSPVR